MAAPDKFVARNLFQHNFVGFEGVPSMLSEAGTLGVRPSIGAITPLGSKMLVDPANATYLSPFQILLRRHLVCIFDPVAARHAAHSTRLLPSDDHGG